MKKIAIYFTLLFLVACGYNEETIKETDLLIKEVRKVLDSKENKQNAEFWQKAYISLNVALEKYKKANPDTIKVTKEAKELFEETYIFRKNNDINGETIIKSIGYIANTITGKGASIPEVINQNNIEQKRLIDKYTKFRLHLEQVENKLCNKYQLNCKAKN